MNPGGDRRALERIAELSAAISHRLYEIQTWSAIDKRLQKSAVIERDMILAAASLRYLAVVTRARAANGILAASPAPWRVRLVVALARWLVRY